MEQYVSILFYLGAIQGILLSVFLFSVKVNKLSNRLLGLLTLFWGLVLFQFPMQDEGLYTKFPHLLKTFSQLLFAFFPLLYLQVKYLISNQKRFNKRDLLHFTPMLINILLWADFYFMGGVEKIDILRNKTLYYQVIQIIGDEVIAAQGIIYSIISIKLLSKYKKEIENYQSNIDKAILKVQYSGILLSLMAWIIGTVGINLDFFNVPVNVDLFIFVYLILVIIIYIISYVALKTPEVFKLDESKIKLVFSRGRAIVKKNGHPVNASSMVPIDLPVDKPDEKVIKPNYDAINNRLIDFMESDKPYLNPELSLQELAENLDLTRHQLSSVINQVHKVNFYEFINSYRITEVKSLMIEPSNSNLKLISIAYDAGFNSKASFNRIFKQMTQMTPSQFFQLQKAG